MFFELLATFVQSIGAITKGNAAASAANYNQRIDNYNATVTDQQGQIAENTLRQQNTARMGMNRANIGASGFEGGSALDLLESNAYNAEMDALNTRYNYQTKATGERMQGNLEGMRAKSEKSGGYLTAAGVLLQGAGKAYQQSNSDSGYGITPFRLGN